MEPASKRTSPSTFSRSSSCSLPMSTCGWRQLEGRDCIGWRSSASLVRGSFEADMKLLSGGEALSVSAFQVEPNAGTREIGIEFPVFRLRSAVEKHVLDANVVVEVFEMAKRNSGTADVHVQRWCAVCRQWTMMR